MLQSSTDLSTKQKNAHVSALDKHFTLFDCIQTKKKESQSNHREFCMRTRLVDRIKWLRFENFNA